MPSNNSKNISTGRKVVGSKYEAFLIEEIVKNPEISNLALAREVKKRYNIRVTSPTVTAWRENYFAENVEISDLRKTLSDATVRQFEKEIFGKVNDTITFYLNASRVIETRIDDLLRQQEIYKKNHFDKSSLALEDLMINYWKLLDTYRSRAYKFTGGVELIHKLQQVIEQVASEAIKLFVPYVAEADREKLKGKFLQMIEKIEKDVYGQLPQISKEVKE